MERKATRQRRYSPRAPLGRKFYEERVFRGASAVFPEKRTAGLSASAGMRGGSVAVARGEGGTAGLLGGQKPPWWLAMRKP